MGETHKLGTKEYELAERFISAFERAVEAYEAQVINQNKMIEQTLSAMKLATNINPT